MILFEKDFKEQGAIVDYQTNNQSFIRMSILLRRMGVMNNKFFLALHQPELQGVDPYDYDNLTDEQMHRIAYEAKINPWYYFRELVRVPAGGTEPISYILNRANSALNWTFFNNIDGFITMPRQVGKTVGVTTLFGWYLYIAAKNVNTGMFAKDNALLQENVSRLKVVRDNLPEYLINKTLQDTNNKEGISYHALNNTYKTYTAQNDSIAAAKQGKGESFSVEHWDELAFYKNNHLSYPSATSATDTAAEQTRQAGLPAANLITTTAGKLTDPSGEFAYHIKSNAMRFTERLYDCSSNEVLMEVLDTNSSNHTIYMEFSYKQLGKDEEWFKRVTRNKPRDSILMDYLNQWLVGGSGSAIPQEILEKIEQSKREPSAITFHKTLALRWYIDKQCLDDKYMMDKPLILAMDTSDNVGEDFTTLLMLDPADMSVVCTCKCNQSNLVYMARCVVSLLRKYKRSIFIPERNKNGAVLLDLILTALDGENFNPYRRIYNTVVQDTPRGEMPDLNSLDRGGVNRKYFGFTTTKASNSRGLLYNNVLMSTVEMNHSKIFDADLIDELKSLTVRNGRIDHRQGGHDDLVVAYLLACYFVLYGSNLHCYGISRDEFLTSMDAKGDTIDPIEKERQLGYRKRISELEDLIEKTRSMMLVQTYQRELNRIKRLVDDNDYDIDMVSAEQMQEEVETNKQKNKRRSAAKTLDIIAKMCQAA